MALIDSALRPLRLTFLLSSLDLPESFFLPWHNSCQMIIAVIAAIIFTGSNFLVCLLPACPCLYSFLNVGQQPGGKPGRWSTIHHIVVNQHG